MVKINRWAALAAGCLIEASSGLNYSFSIIAPLFKERFGYDDERLATMAVAVNLGGYFAILSGQVYDMLGMRHNLGPRVVIWVGCVLMTTGYGAIWAQVTGVIATSYVRLLICAFVAGNASTWWDTSALVTNVQNFPDDRGSVMGILKAFVGMSTSIYASMYWALFAAPTPGPATPPPSAAHGLAGNAGAGSIHNGIQYGLGEGDGVGKAGDVPGGAVGGGPLAFLAVIAIAPSLLNLMGSLFVNLVPVDYHEPTQPPVPHHRTPSSTPAALAPPEPAHHNYHHHHHHHQQVMPVNKHKRFTGLYALVAVVAVLQAGFTLAGQGQPAGTEIDKIHAFVLLVLLCLVLLIPVSTGPLARPSLRKPSVLNHAHQQQVQQHVLRVGGADPETADLDAPLLLNSTEDIQASGNGSGSCDSDGEEVVEEADKNEAPPIKNLTPGQAMCLPSFWAVFLIFMSGCASGLTLLNNLSPLVLALGGHPGQQVAFVSLFSVANASGRLLFGHLSEYWLHRTGVPRTVFLILASFLMTLAMASMAGGAPLYLLYLLSLATGLAFGGHWSAVPAVASDLFGLGSFAGIYCILQIAAGLGALVFSSWLAGRNLLRASEQQTGDYCVGLTCFQQTWTTLLAVQLLSVCLGLWLWHSTKHMYKRTLAAAKTDPQQAPAKI